MKIFYFGADASFEKITLTQSFTRRNTNILKVLSTHECIKKTYIVQRSVPEKLISRIGRNLFKKGKVKDVFFSYLFPQWFPASNIINRWISFCLMTIQVGRIASQKDIIWCYGPKGYKAFKESGWSGRLIFDTDHNILDDPNIEEIQKSERRKLLKEIGSKAEKVLSSSRSMLKWFKNNTVSEAVLLMNGVDSHRFENIKVTSYPFPAPIIGYVGSLSKWVHFDWMEQLIKDHPEWNFVVIGKPFNDQRYKIIEKYANAHLLGPKTYEEVPSYIKSFDVALGLYKQHPALDVNSMKIYEYLAAGVPVVSSAYHLNLESDFGYLIQTAQTYEELVVLLEKTLEKRCVFDNQRRKKFIQQSSWEKRIDEIIKTHLS